VHLHPRRALTIFTAVSGSGKSSIVFDTLATEARRRPCENFPLFIPDRSVHLERPCERSRSYIL